MHPSDPNEKLARKQCQMGAVMILFLPGFEVRELWQSLRVLNRGAQGGSFGGGMGVKACRDLGESHTDRRRCRGGHQGEPTPGEPRRLK